MELKINTTPLRLRKHLGVLGISLPFILWVFNRFQIESSISHYYYTSASVIFTGILFAFGLFLFSYRGYDKEKGEIVTDNLATNIAGVLALITAVIPTTCGLEQSCEAPNGHNDQILGAIHLISAAGFFIIMGWMAFYKFTKGQISGTQKRKKNLLFRICGIGVWASLIFISIDKWGPLSLTEYGTFIGETIALVFFGTAWLVKGGSLKKFGL